MKIETAVTKIIWEGWSTAVDCLRKKEEFENISFDIFSKISFELIIFYMYFCDRLIFSYAGEEKRNAIIDGVFYTIFKTLDDYNDSDDDKNDFYLQCLAQIGSAEYLRITYNKTASEYAKYKKIISEKDESPKDTLVWEFSKKIANLLNNNPVILVIIHKLVLDTVVFYTDSLESVFEGDGKNKTIKYSSASTGMLARVKNIKTKEKFVISTARNQYGIYETVVFKASFLLMMMLKPFISKPLFAINSSTAKDAEKNHIRTAELFEQLDPKDMIRKYKTEGKVGAQLF